MRRAIRQASTLATNQSGPNLRSVFPALPKKVKIVEVGPRDGLQNEQEILPARKSAFHLLLDHQSFLPYIVFICTYYQHSISSSHQSSFNLMLIIYTTPFLTLPQFEFTPPSCLLPLPCLNPLF